MLIKIKHENEKKRRKMKKKTKDKKGYDHGTFCISTVYLMSKEFLNYSSCSSFGEMQKHTNKTTNNQTNKQKNE